MPNAIPGEKARAGVEVRRVSSRVSIPRQALHIVVLGKVSSCDRLAVRRTPPLGHSKHCRVGGRGCRHASTATDHYSYNLIEIQPVSKSQLVLAEVMSALNPAAHLLGQRKPARGILDPIRLQALALQEAQRVTLIGKS